MRNPTFHLVLASLVCVTSLAAQASPAVGVTVATAKLSDSRSEQALSGIVQLQPRPWLSFAALPSFVRVTDVVSGSTATTSGIGDLPLSTAVAHGFPGPAAPVVAAALTVVLPTGNAACGLGNGQTSAGFDLGFAASPDAAWHVSMDASRSISHASSQSTLSAPRATSLLLGAGHDLTPQWRADGSLAIDVGSADSTQALSRTLGGGLTRRLGHALALTLDASAGLTAGSPKWVVSLGFGTAFAGPSPVALSAPLKRLRSTFAGGVGRARPGKTGC